MKFFLYTANMVQLLLHINGDNDKNKINCWQTSNHQFFLSVSQHFAAAYAWVLMGPTSNKKVMF